MAPRGGLLTLLYFELGSLVTVSSSDDVDKHGNSDFSINTPGWYRVQVTITPESNIAAADIGLQMLRLDLAGGTVIDILNSSGRSHLPDASPTILNLDVVIRVEDPERLRLQLIPSGGAIRGPDGVYVAGAVFVQIERLT